MTDDQGFLNTGMKSDKNSQISYFNGFSLYSLTPYCLNENSR